MSSAALGMYGAPALSASAGIPPALAAGKMDFAVCSGPQAGGCSWPSTRVVDGAYVDNLGTPPPPPHPDAQTSV